MAFGLKLRKITERRNYTDELPRPQKSSTSTTFSTESRRHSPADRDSGLRSAEQSFREPKVFLMDEPLSNLDAKLRVQMRTEIGKLHHRLQTTFIYVTHDQTEAMTMGTRIVVMKDGLMFSR